MSSDAAHIVLSEPIERGRDLARQQVGAFVDLDRCNGRTAQQFRLVSLGAIWPGSPARTANSA